MPWRRIFFTITLSLLFFPDASAVTLLDNEELRLDLGAYLRLDAEFLNNTVDLDSRLKDDKDAYLGLDYNLSLDAQLKDSDTELYFKFERNGPTDYDAPLFTHNTLMTSCGVIEDYRNDELLPQLEEFWMDTPFVGATRLKAGLYAYQVGQGFSLNGSYENYGFTIYRESAKSSWRLYYCRPDLVYKNHLGPRIRQEEEQGVKYQHNASNFFSFDAKWEDKGYSINPYVGMLSDYTSSGKRNSIYAAPVDRDLLGTVGISLRFTGEKPFFNFETARNFGRADSSDPAYKDIVHKGYLVYAEAGLDFDRAKPSVQFLVCSGNRVSLDEVAAGATSLNSGANRSFSSYSPLNFNLSDSISSVNADSRPVVATGAVRTGAGKSQTTRRVAGILAAQGRRVVVVRHPMPYGDLARQAVQRFATFADLDAHECTIEEREEYEPHLERGMVVYAGVDYERILRSAEQEADVIVWDGGNNDMPFFKPDLFIVVADPHRAGNEITYHPGETNLRMADIVIINKVDTATPESVKLVRENIRAANPNARVIEAASPIFTDDPEAIRGKRVLAIEDGPTLTHGGMGYGAGVVAAQRYGASELVDPRPYAAGSIREVFQTYPNIGPLLPAMGYGTQQIIDLQETINATPCDLVLIATPIDLTRILKISKPAQRVRYELQEIGRPTLEDLLQPVLAAVQVKG